MIFTEWLYFAVCVLQHIMCVCVCVLQANNSTNSTEDAQVEDTVAFPNDLYSQASKASVSHPQLSSDVRQNKWWVISSPCIEKCVLSWLLLIFFFLSFQAEDKLHFTVQVLEEAAALFEEDHSNASWEENTVENFVNVVNQQADGLRSCVSLSVDQHLTCSLEKINE